MARDIRDALMGFNTRGYLTADLLEKEEDIMAPNMLAVVEALAAEHVVEFRQAHRDGLPLAQKIAFCERVVRKLNELGYPNFGLNGKRGDPNNPSLDAISYMKGSNPADVEVIDIIASAGTVDDAGNITDPGQRPPSPAWQDVSHAGPGHFIPVTGGSAPGPTPLPTPNAPLWEARHAALVARFPPQSTPNRDWILRVAQQFAYAFPGEGWGVKRAQPNSPQSDNVIARQPPSGGFFGYRLIPATANPVAISLTGQTFVPVSPVDHLGGASPPHPAPTPAPVPQPAYPGDAPFDAVGVQLWADYAAHGHPPDPQMGRWFGRTIWDHLREGLTLQQSIEKHRAEWLAALTTARDA